MVIETHGLSKKYRDTFAVRDLDLAVPAGSGSAFLGLNGSGKTTTIRMLLGLARPTSGAGRVFGQPIFDEAACAQIRQRIGYVGEDKRLYRFMTVKEILDFVRPLYPNWNRAREHVLLGRFDLPPGRKCKTLSKGMRTKLALVLAMA